MRLRGPGSALILRAAERATVTTFHWDGHSDAATLAEVAADTYSACTSCTSLDHACTLNHAQTCKVWKRWSSWHCTWVAYFLVDKSVMSAEIRPAEVKHLRDSGEVSSIGLPLGADSPLVGWPYFRGWLSKSTRFFVNIEIAKSRYPLIKSYKIAMERERERERDCRENIHELLSWKRFSILFGLYTRIGALLLVHRVKTICITTTVYAGCFLYA